MSAPSIALKHILCFAYGTSLPIAQRHHAQAQAIAFTIGGLIVFVTLPFLFFGTTYLLIDEFSGIASPVLRWSGLLASSAVVTLAVVWVERALLVLADAIWAHWSSQLAMFALRLSMVFLFSAVIAQKWVLNSYQGPVRTELATMRDEAFEQEKITAAKTFDLKQTGDRLETASNRVRELESKLVSLPSEIKQLSDQVQKCKTLAAGLWAEFQELHQLASLTVQQEARRTEMQIQARAKSAECKQREEVFHSARRGYREPLEIELGQQRKLAATYQGALVSAEVAANTQALERANEAAQALKLSGSDHKAFERVRAKHPDINSEVRNKTLLLAGLELLPLLLKILTCNSPISTETRALLQQESETFRSLLRDSVRREHGAMSALSPRGPRSLIAAFFHHPAPVHARKDAPRSYPNTAGP